MHVAQPVQGRPGPDLRLARGQLGCVGASERKSVGVARRDTALQNRAESTPGPRSSARRSVKFSSLTRRAMSWTGVLVYSLTSLMRRFSTEEEIFSQFCTKVCCQIREGSLAVRHLGAAPHHKGPARQQPPPPKRSRQPSISRAGRKTQSAGHQKQEQAMLLINLTAAHRLQDRRGGAPGEGRTMCRD